MIRFEFNPEAAKQAAGFFLTRLQGRADRAKLMKLLYLADRESFLTHGSPITGDSQWALPYGPVPSCTLDMLSMNNCGTEIASVGNQFVLNADLGTSALSPSNVAVLNSVFNAYGSWQTWKLVDETHRFPEYVECAIQGSSARIPYECILVKHGASRGRVRQGYPVIGLDMSSQMSCPFSESEPDL